MRAISTVLDASLCLLFVSASVLTLAGTPLPREVPTESGPGATADVPDAPDTADAPNEPDTADELAEVLATSTARVTYRAGNESRTVHDTLAGLLAAAAVADAGSELSRTFQRAAVERVNRTLGRHTPRGIGVQVVTSSSREPPITAGTDPPPDADVHAAAFEVRRVTLTVRTWSR